MNARHFSEMTAFVAVATHGGFTAAATATGLRKAGLSERVQSLEKRLGLSLLARTTRSVRVTDEGRLYLERARRAVEAFEDAERTLQSARAEPRGTLRVNAHPALAVDVLPDVVVPYLAAYPQVRVVLESDTRNVDLPRENVDLALRVGPLPDSGLVARRIGLLGGGCYASPCYLDAHGTPERPDELARHATLVVAQRHVPRSWPFVDDGTPFDVAVRPRLVVSGFGLAVEAAVLGSGIVRAPERFVREALDTGRLVPVLESWTPGPVPMFALHAPGAAAVPKVRAFVDRLVEHRRERGVEHNVVNGGTGPMSLVEVELK